MDRLICGFECRFDADLKICDANGVAYQSDMSAGLIEYDEAYFDRYMALEGTPIANALQAGRCAMLKLHADDGARVLDIGAGAGTFIRAAKALGYEAKGFDVMPKSVDDLKRSDSFSDDPGQFDVVTFWDSIEHIEAPETILCQIRFGTVVLVAIPVFEDLNQIRDSKHYRPGEHLYYWTAQGFIDWMWGYGFFPIGQSSHETEAGRESIGAFAFRKVVEVT